MNEFQIISKYFSKLTKKNKGAFNLKDDIFYDFKNKSSISIDTYNEGTHFLNFKYPNLIIKKCLRSALSDLLCKGVIPKYYFISASGNAKNFTKKNLIKIYKSLATEQKKYSIKLSGGDTIYSKQLSFTFVILGYSKKKPILRSGAKFKDDIYITNNIGDSYLGLICQQRKKKIPNFNYFINSFFKPNIPFNFSKKIIDFATSSIDISDGLFKDLNHLSENSGFSFNIDVNKIPISRYLKKYLIDNKKKKNQFISNGDDYQLIFTSNKKHRKLIERIAYKTKTKITRVGVVNNSKKHRISFKNQGYVHKF